MALDASTPIEQVAATVSAVQIYTSGLYVSRDLDFVSAAGHREIESVLGKLGFVH